MFVSCAAACAHARLRAIAPLAAGFLSLTIFSFVSLGDGAQAQPVPGTVDPGRIEERIPERPAPPPGAAPTIPKTPGLKAPDNAKDIRFSLRDIRFTGVSVYVPSDLKALGRDLIGKTVSLLDIFKLANEITAFYRRNGYLISQAVVPAQRVQNGTVRIHVVEGFVDKVTLDAGGLEKEHDLWRVTAYTDRIRRSRPLHQDDLERYLLLANDLPGLTVRGILKRSADTPGAADMIVRVREKKFDAWATLDNRGSRFLGPYQLEVGGAYNSAVQLGDRTTARGFWSIIEPDELQYYEARHEIPLGTEGTSLEGLGSYTRTRPGSFLAPLEIEGESYRGRIRVRHPFVRSRRENLISTASLEVRDSDVDILGFPLSRDRLRSFRTRTSYDWVDSWLGISKVQAGFHQGLDVWDARANSRAFARPDYTKVTAKAQRHQKIGGGFSAFFAGAGQFAFAQVPSSEEIGIGGREFGRAFDPAEITGDHGLSVLSELRYTGEPLTVQGRKVGYQVFGYWDWGRVWHIDTTGRNRFDTISSIGAGIRTTIDKRYSASIEVSGPVTGRVAALGTKGNDARVFFVIGIRY